jgi:hypothetical protein
MTINENNQIKKILAPTLKLLKKADGSSRKVIFKKAISDAKNFLDHFATSDFDKKVFAQVANILDKTQQDGEIEQHMDSLNQKGKQEAKELLSAIDHTFAFIKTTFGEGQEMIALMINLLASYHFVLFITYFPSQTFLEYNGKLLIDKKNKQLMLEIKAVEDQMDELKLN